MKFLDFFCFGLELFIEVLFNKFIPIVLLIFFLLVELKLLLNDGLNILLSETFYQVELVLENDHTKKDFSAFELTFAKLEFPNFSDFFHNGFDFIFELLIKCDQLKCPINRVETFSLCKLFILSFIIRVYEVVDFCDFLCWCYLGSISFVVNDDLLPVQKWKTKSLILSEMVLFLIILFSQHFFYCR